MIQDFGVQLKQRFWLGTETVTFLGIRYSSFRTPICLPFQLQLADKDAIDSVLLYEVIHGSQIHFQIAFLLKGGGHFEHSSLLIPCFKHVYPGLEALQLIYAECAPLGRVKHES